MSCCADCGSHGCACGCGTNAATPLTLYNRPGLGALAYRVGRYTDFRSTMQAALSSSAFPALAGLRTRETDDPAMALLDAWAVGVDVLSFYQERIANEGYLRTATERRSVLELGRLVDYRLRPGVAASVYLAYTVEKDAAPVTLPAGSRAQSVPAPGQQMQTFEIAEPLDARFDWNALKPRLTRPQNLRVANAGALDELWLAGTATALKPNDPLLLLFGDPVSSVPALRRVLSVEVQQASARSRVALQPLDPVTVAILAAAETAIAALAGDAHWQPVLEQVRRLLLLGQPNGGNAITFADSFGMAKNRNHGPAAVQDFMQSVTQAFGGDASAPAAPAGFGALFDALTLRPTLQPASSLQLSRNIASALAVASDTRPQLLLNFETRLAGSFYRAWTSVPSGQPSPELTGVFALRASASLFGYNALRPISLIANPDTSSRRSIPFVSAPGNDWAPNESADRVQLDNAIEAIQPGSYLVIRDADSKVPVVAQAATVQVHPRSDYGMSGRTTDIVLVHPGDTSLWDLSGDDDIGTLRRTQVYAQSEALALADEVIGDTVGFLPAGAAPRSTGDTANRLVLDTTVDGLQAGRWVIVQGQRSDVPGTDAVSAAELVMLVGVEQGVDANLPGDTVHSTLVFANQGLAYTYRRDSVSVCANVVRATHGETRNEVLGSGNAAISMQAFALKQSPLTFVSAATPDGVQSTLSVRVNQVEWHETRNFAFVGATARSFITRTDDSGVTTVAFGDGSHGARLPSGVENVTAVYRNGIGTPGNVNAQQVSLLASKPLGVKAVINPLPASGGADAETRDDARANVPLAVMALDRLVSVSDYADFSRTFGGVGKAIATRVGDGVQVTIAGVADAPIDTTSDLYRNLLQALQQYGDPLLPLQLDVRERVALTLSAKVGLAADYAWEWMEPVLRAALLDAFGVARRRLAQSVYLSEIVGCMQAVRGVAWVNVDQFGSLDEATVLAGFGDKPAAGDGTITRLADASSSVARSTALPSRVTAWPARHDRDGMLRAAQLVGFVVDVPDTLLLQEATA
jgi:hypothetical protein